MTQAATFKNIKSLQPLLDRVLVQRFKAETVGRSSLPFLLRAEAELRL